MFKVNIKIKKYSKKKFILIIVFCLLALFSTFSFDFFVSAVESNTEELNLSVNEVVNNIDFSEIEVLVADLNNLNLFETTIKDKVTQILNGEYFTNYSNLLSGLVSLFFIDIREFMPILFLLIAIGLLTSLIINFKSDSSKGVTDTIHFVCFSIMIIVVLVAYKDILTKINDTLGLILSQMQLVFPILITLLASIGSLTTISIYNPIVAVLTSVISIIFEKFLYPIFILIFLLTVIGNLTDTIKLNKITDFLNSTFKWCIGIVFTIFTGFLTIQGISAGKFDSVSIKATKFAVKSYIPIIGSYISDGIDFLILGSVLVKNTIGLIGVMIIFITIISPIINILVFKLGLQLCGGVLELTGNNKMSNFLTNCSKLLILPIVLILGISLMYVITICLIMCTANIF